MKRADRLTGGVAVGGIGRGSSRDGWGRRCQRSDYGRCDGDDRCFGLNSDRRWVWRNVSARARSTSGEKGESGKHDGKLHGSSETRGPSENDTLRRVFFTRPSRTTLEEVCNRKPSRYCCTASEACW